MASSVADSAQHLAVGVNILYKMNSKVSRQGKVLARLRERNKWSVEWEDGTTSSVSLRPQSHNVWELLPHKEKISTGEEAGKQGASRKVPDDIKQPNREQGEPSDSENGDDQASKGCEKRDGSTEAITSEADIESIEQVPGSRASKGAGSDHIENLDTTALNPDEATAKQPSPEDEKRKEKMERLARLSQRLGSLIKDKAPTKDCKPVRAAGDILPEMKAHSEGSPSSVSPDKDGSVVDKKSKAQELIARLKARTEHSLAAATPLSAGHLLRTEPSRQSDESMLQKRSSPESPRRFTSFSEAEREEHLVTLGATLLTESREQLRGTSMFWKNGFDSTKRARYDLDFDFDGSVPSHDMDYSSVNAIKFCGSRDLMKKERKNFPKETVDELKRWFEEHIMHPYPDDGDKDRLAEKTGLTTSQVSYWFVNARKRIWQPMLQDKQQSTLQGYAKVTAADVMLRGICSKSLKPPSPALFDSLDLSASKRSGDAAASANDGGAMLAELIAGQAPPGAPVPVARQSPANLEA